ncbi:MAG TPA: hypothetical protein VFX16_02800 [Pseudonocardiaceae bacterium]|nr:hypothetical protein [Pseudonocardiaceae bacterium]
MRGGGRWLVPIVVVVAIVGAVVALRSTGSARPPAAVAAQAQAVVDTRAVRLTKAFADANAKALPADLELMARTRDNPVGAHRPIRFQYYPDQADGVFSQIYQASGELSRRSDGSFAYGFSVRIDHMDAAKLVASYPGLDPNVTVECGVGTVADSCVQRTFPDGARARVTVLPITHHRPGGALNPKTRLLDTELDVLWPGGDRMTVDASDTSTNTDTPLNANVMFALVTLPGLR